MSAIERCRTAALGGHVARCENPGCGHTLRNLAFHNKAVMYDVLMKAAADATLTITADPKHLDARIGTSFWRGSRADLDALAQGLAPLPETAQELSAAAKMLGAAPSDIHLGKAARSPSTRAAIDIVLSVRRRLRAAGSRRARPSCCRSTTSTWSSRCQLPCSEAAIKSTDLSQYRIVYFATHGLVAGEVKGLGEPALALTLPAEPTDFGDDDQHVLAGKGAGNWLQ